MTERQIPNRIKKIKELEAQVSMIGDQIETLKQEIKDHMGESETLNVCGFLVRWCKVVSNRLDTSRIKKELPELYSKYTTQTSSRRFTITAAK